jgi:serine/threonine protein kinase
MVGKDSPPTSPGGQREKRFPAVGTNRYMAPEVEFDSRFGVQVCVLCLVPIDQSFHPTDHSQLPQQADIFSLGVVLHVLLTGTFPKTGLNQPARIDPGIPDVDGLRGLLEGMLHGDPYQRPHSFEVLDSPFLQPLRKPGDTLLGDLDDEAEQGGRVMLLQIRRGVNHAAASSASSSAPPLGLPRYGAAPAGSNGHSHGQQSQSQSSSGVAPPLPPQLLAVQSEERPLEVYCSYMDLAEIDDDRSTVVVCGRKEGMRVRAGVYACVMNRQTADTTTTPNHHSASRRARPPRWGPSSCGSGPGRRRN